MLVLALLGLMGYWISVVVEVQRAATVRARSTMITTGAEVSVTYAATVVATKY